MIAWTIAGSDSGGGAGIQADLKTFHGLGVHGCTVITALTAQNTRAVRAADAVAPEMILAQINALAEDLPPRAVKTGMLGNASVIETVAGALEKIDCFYVCDPVMIATSGGALMDPGARDTLVRRLLPRVDLLTPNLPEASALCGRAVHTPAEIEDCARELLGMGARSVWIKGGHGDQDFSSDYWTDGKDRFWLHSPRIDTIHTHGSGCTLSAAVAALIASGYPLPDALTAAKAYVTAAIRAAGPVGGGFGPVAQGGLPVNAMDMPVLTESAARRFFSFPDCGERILGLYPLVDRAADLEKLVASGVSTIQLRIKDLEGEALKREIENAVAAARRYDARLFINDHWQAAIEAGAYGVHLGQEDLNDTAMEALEKASLRVGLSTHNWRELARALAYNPSYVALGPIFPTGSKQLSYQEQGLERLAQWSQLAGRPVVAIGGIGREQIVSTHNAGASGIAVLSGLFQNSDPVQEARIQMSLIAESR